MSPAGYVAIIDYQIGNLYSVQNAMHNIGLKSVITSDKHMIENADAAILPGVGAFGDAMNNLAKLDLVCPIKDFVNTGKAFMGICLGLQLLFTESEEFGCHRGLDIIPGYVRKFSFNSVPGQRNVKVPQIAWNQIFSASQKWEGTELDSVQEGEFMYFVHSYFVVPDIAEHQLSITEYEGHSFCSSIKKSNIFAAQFHPEKSSSSGIRILENFKNEIDKRLK